MQFYIVLKPVPEWCPGASKCANSDVYKVEFNVGESLRAVEQSANCLAR